MCGQASLSIRKIRDVSGGLYALARQIALIYDQFDPLLIVADFW